MTQRAVHILAALGVAIIFWTSLTSCRHQRVDAPLRSIERLDGPPLLRVRVVKRAASCTVRCDSPLRIYEGARQLAYWTSLPERPVTPTPTGFAVGAEPLSADALRFEPEGDALIYVDGTAYRGRMRLDRSVDALTLDAINLIDLERYLWGVVACEVRSDWPMPAIRAQAVAARTYAFRQSRRRAGYRFHLSSTDADQVYRGVSGESRRTVAAVDDTRGAMLIWGSERQPIMAFYSACCGGATTRASLGLGEKDIPPLSGTECPYCDPARHVPGTGTPMKYFRWTQSLQKAWIAAELREAGFDAQAVRGVSVQETDASGRAVRVAIATDQAQPIVMSGRSFRELAAFDRIRKSPADRFPGLDDVHRFRSTRFTVRDDGAAVMVEGSGWGHGVGMCQWGAKGMADNGCNYLQILALYYPGAQVAQLYP